MLDLAKRQGWQLYIVTTLESESARIREGRIGPGGHTFVGLVNNTRAELFMDKQPMAAPHTGAKGPPKPAAPIVRHCLICRE